MTPQILIIDDEPAIRRLIRAALERAGYQSDEAATAADGLSLARRPGTELVLLDLGLPDRDGLELIPLLKGMDRAIIILTARSDTAEKVTALDLGADDYIVKPFDTEELLARVRTALRHRTTAPSGPLTIGPITIDMLRREVTHAGALVPLTRKELALLAELARHPGRVITHHQLLTTIWGPAHKDDVEYLRVTVRALRRKLEPDPAAPTLIRNEPGVGYRLMG